MFKGLGISSLLASNSLLVIALATPADAGLKQPDKQAAKVFPKERNRKMFYESTLIWCQWMSPQ
jgi:hypothetical protein